MVLFFMHIPLVVNHTINATPPERLQQYKIMVNKVIFIGFSYGLDCPWIRSGLKLCMKI